jgi:RHS repeat-associated protein
MIGLFLFLLLTSAQAVDSLGTWTAKNAELSVDKNYDIYGMAYGNNTFVIVGQDFDKLKAFTANSPSGDPKTWTVRASGSASEGFNSVIFSNGRFIAVCKQPDSGNARIWTSDDNGNTWKTRNSDNAGLIVAGGLHAVASDGNGKLIAAGSERDGKGGWITVSADNGTTWRVVRDGTAAKFFSGNMFYGAGYALGNWYAVSLGRTYKSSDTAIWTDIGGPTAGGLGYKIASNETTVVIASSAGPKWSTDNGTIWHSGTQAKGFESVNSLLGNVSSVVYADGYFVLLTRDAGDVWVSETGRYWKRWKLPTVDNTYAFCYAKKSFWCGGWYEKISKSPAWFKARNGCSSDYPYTLFDAEDGPPNRIGLPQYRVNTASLNLVLESTLFYATTLCSPLNFKLVYNSKPTEDGAAEIGLFGKNWKFRYESAVGRFGQEAQVFAGGGRSHIFATPNGENLDTFNSDVTLNPPDGIFDTLKYIYNGGTSRFELTLKKSHLTYVYGKAGTGANNVGLFYLTAIKDQFGNQTDLVIDAPSGQITRITDESNRQFNFTYDAVSKLCSGITMQGGRSVSFTYDEHKNLKTITDMMGYVGTYTYDEAPLSGNLGFLTRMVTAGKTSTFTYDERPGYEAGTVENPGDMYVTSVTRANGTKISYEILKDGETVQRTDASGQTTLISNKDGQTTSIADPLGNVRNIQYNSAKLPTSVTDEKGGVFTYEYDDSGNMLTMTDALGNVTTHTYDANNNPLTIKNALNNTWTYTYDGYYRPLTVTSPAPLNNVTTFTYTGSLPSTIKDARNKTTAFTFDGYGNVVSVTSPTGGVTSLTYDGNGFRCASITDANARKKIIDWDNNDRLTKITYDSVAGKPSYTNTYDAFGQTKFTDELSNETNIVRDELGFVTKITDPLGYITQKEYDADNRPSRIIDPLGRSTSTSYDNGGRPILFTDARGFKIVREYDGAGNLISFKDKNGAETTYSYDKNNRFVSTTDPLKKASTITRNAIGQITSTKNARGQLINFTYDNDGRLTKKESKITTTGTATTLAEYTLDANGNILTQKDEWGTTTYVYDNNNRITNITYPDTKAVSLTWTAGGQISSITYPNGLVATYTYDNFNRIPVPSVLKNNPGTELVGENRSTNAVTGVVLTGPATGTFTLDYNKRGQISSIVRPNSTRTDYTYDNGGRITQIIHSGTADVDFTVVYSPDAIGNISSESFSGAAHFQSPVPTTNLALAYNIAGELTKKGTQSCASDADGNLTDLGAGTVKCTYDPLNRLTQMIRKSKTATTTTVNTYNADGYRVKSVIAGVETIYHYLPSGVLLFTSDSIGDTFNILAGTAILATYDTVNNLQHYYGDRQGHVRFIADSAGIVSVKYNYLPYGQIIASSSSVKNPYTFNGILGVRDEGNGIFYMQNRFYEAASARFLSRDPLGFEVGSNLYAFGNNNPMIYADPSGKGPVVAALVIGTFIWGAVQAVGALKNFGQGAVDYVNNRQKDDELCMKDREAWLKQQGREANEKKAEEIGTFAKQGATAALQVEVFRFSPSSSSLGEVAVDQARGAVIEYATSSQGEESNASSTSELPPPQPQETEQGE